MPDLNDIKKSFEKPINGVNLIKFIGKYTYNKFNELVDTGFEKLKIYYKKIILYK